MIRVPLRLVQRSHYYLDHNNNTGNDYFATIISGTIIILSAGSDRRISGFVVSWKIINLTQLHSFLYGFIKLSFDCNNFLAHDPFIRFSLGHGKEKFLLSDSYMFIKRL